MNAILNDFAHGLDIVAQFLLKLKGMQGLLQNIADLSTPRRRLLLLTLDILVFAVSIYAALLLRFDLDIPAEKLELYGRTIGWLVGFKSCCFYVLGMYRPLLRYSGLELVEAVLKATLWSESIALILTSTTDFIDLPRSVQIIAATISLVLVISLRVILRRLVCKIDTLTFRVNQLNQAKSTSLRRQGNLKRSVIIYGAGQAGTMLAQAMQRDQHHEIIAFVDDDSHLMGRKAHGISIYHPSSLDSLVTSYDVSLLLLAIPSAHPQQRQQVLKKLHHLDVEIKTVPALAAIVSGKVSIAQTREIDITDLLGRAEVLPDPELLQANIGGKSVLVTGAGGSIGSELCRQIAQQNPCLLILYEVSEFALYSIEMELREAYPDLNCVACLGSVTDAARLRQVIIEHQVETIYHSAAYKHVPLVEANPAPGIMNNVYGTLVAARTANECRVKTFVLISTDKAVRPTNIMGATKRVAELILQALATQPDIQTRFIMVRFGNVLGSSGSVVPRFREQIVQRKPITITHPDITRYFMSIPEAARLVIQAGAMGQGGEVFLLDMGEPVRIYDLAVQMIELSGLKPGEDIEVQITGLRPGEKLYEELLIEGDNVITTRHPKIYAAKEAMIPWASLEPMLDHLVAVALQNQTDQVSTVSSIKATLKQLVPEYQPRSQDKLTQVGSSRLRHGIPIPEGLMARKAG